MKSLQESTILIVEDQEINIRLLKGMLSREGFTNVVHTRDSRLALQLFHECRPDLILLNWHMPHLGGCQILGQLRAGARREYVPVLVLSADASPCTRQQALTCGAADFVLCPFLFAELMLRVRNFLRARQLQLQTLEECDLEAMVRERTAKLQENHFEILERLAEAVEHCDSGTSEHTRRVACLATLIAREMEMPEDKVMLLRRAATLHDIGKILVPDHILLKPSALSSAEFEQVKIHTEAGATLLYGGPCEIVNMAHTIALTHHEHWDGSGYPRGLQGEDIPLVGRIVALADVYDALSHERPYKRAWSHAEVVAEIKSQSGYHFDPLVVDAFLRLEAEFDFQENLTQSYNGSHLQVGAAPSIAHKTITNAGFVQNEARTGCIIPNLIS